MAAAAAGGSGVGGLIGGDGNNKLQEDCRCYWLRGS